eukprot:3534796-Pleurochrysis_carterae.AAC.2
MSATALRCALARPGSKNAWRSAQQDVAAPYAKSDAFFAPVCSFQIEKMVLKVPASTANLGPGFDSMGGHAATMNICSNAYADMSL